jgi:hypothetical protein
LAGAIPVESPIILDWGAAQPNEAILRRWSEHHVELQLVRADGPDDSNVKAACGLGPRVLLRLQRSLSVAEALDMADAMRRSNFEVEPVLEAASDVVVLQILSSLGVQLRIDVHVFASGQDWLEDLLQDQILQPGPRQPAAPLGHLVAESFEETCQIAAWDLRENDWHVDLRAQPPPAERESWLVPELLAMSIPHLIEPRVCAFCEGLLWCNGYLLSDNEANQRYACQKAFTQFVKLLNLQREANANRSSPHTNP